MVYTAPMTAVSGEPFLASEFNTFVRDNLEYLKTTTDDQVADIAAISATQTDILAAYAPAVATSTGGLITPNGAGAVAQRVPNGQYVGTEVSTTSDTFVTLTGGPSVTVTTGSAALVVYNAFVNNTNFGSGGEAHIAFQVSGATTLATANAYIVSADLNNSGEHVTISKSYIITDITPGSNTFTMTYADSGGNAAFERRYIGVIPF